MKSAEDVVVPGRLYGLRAWTVGGGKRLEALAQHGSWASGSNPTRARCAAGRGHRAPAHDCSCGLYALHPSVAQCKSSFARARDAARAGRTADVSGIVAAWGAVELHESGFRAEYARPHALLLPAGAGDGYAQLVRALAAGHHAEVWKIDSGHDLHRRCVEHNLGLSKAAVKDLLGPQLRRQRRRDRVRSWRETAVDLAVGAATLLFGGLVPILFVVAIVIGLLSGGGDEPRSAPRPASKLQVIEQRLIEIDGADFYVALVRNPSRTRSALRVHPTGAFLDESGDAISWPDRPANTDNRPSLAPGQVGVVWDWVDSYESLASEVKQIRVSVVASRWADGRQRSPLAVSRLRLERPRCLVTATVRSAWRRIDAEFAFIARSPRGRILGAGTWVAGPLPRGRSRRILERIEPRPCLGRRFELEAYPNVGAAELRRDVRGSHGRAPAGA